MRWVARGLVVAVLAGCGGAADFGPPLTILVHTPPDSSLESLQVTSVRVTVAGGDLLYPVIETFPFSLGTGSLGAIPYGLDRTVSVEAMALNEEGTEAVVARGKSLPTAVPVSQRAEVHVFVAPVGKFSAGVAFAAGTAPAVLGAGRIGHTATALADGRVLITGGAGVAVDTAGELAIERIYDTIEVYDPATGIMETLPARLYPGRAFHTATRLRGTQSYVLLAGGLTFIEGGLVSLAVSDIFSPGGEGGRTLFQTMDLETPRARHAATRRPDGSVLVTGGVWINDGRPQDFDDVEGPVALLNSAELFKVRESEPDLKGCNNTEWTYCVQSQMGTARVDHASVPHLGGVLVVGGQDAGGPLSSTEIYAFDEGGGERTGAFVDGPRLNEARVHPAVVRRSDEVVVVIGGTGPPSADTDDQEAGGPLRSIEVFHPDSLGGSFSETLGFLTSGRDRLAAAVLDDDRILVAGGGARTAPTWPTPGCSRSATAGCPACMRSRTLGCPTLALTPGR